MDGGIVYQPWPAAAELYISNKPTEVNHGLERIAEADCLNACGSSTEKWRQSRASVSTNICWLK